MPDFVIPLAADNSTDPEDSTLLGLSAQESRASELAALQDNDSKPRQHGLFFLAFVVLTALAVVLILVLRFIRHYRADRKAAREDQLRTVTWEEGDSESEQVRALVTE